MDVDLRGHALDLDMRSSRQFWLSKISAVRGSRLAGQVSQRYLRRNNVPLSLSIHRRYLRLIIFVRVFLRVTQGR